MHKMTNDFTRFVSSFFQCLIIKICTYLYLEIISIKHNVYIQINIIYAKNVFIQTMQYFEYLFRIQYTSYSYHYSGNYLIIYGHLRLHFKVILFSKKIF